MEQSQDDYAAVPASAEVKCESDEQNNEETKLMSGSFEKVFGCKFCGRAFAYKKRLASHLEVCKKRKKAKMKRKKDSLFDKSKKKDATVDKSLTNISGDKKKSLASSSGNKLENTYKCSVCSQVFSQKIDLNHHFTKHSLDKPYECIECRRRFSKKEYLIRHISIHSEDKVYSCSLCSYQSSRTDRYKSHMQRHGVSDPFKCSLCGEGFPGLKGLNKHLNSHNSSALDPGGNSAFVCSFSCVECGLTFEKAEKYKSHMSAHGVKEPYKCSLCGESFSNKLHLNRHLSNHNKILQVSGTVSPKRLANGSGGDEAAELSAFSSEGMSSSRDMSRTHSPEFVSENLELQPSPLLGFDKEETRILCSEDKFILLNEKSGLRSLVEYYCEPCEKKFHKDNYYLTHMQVVHKIYPCLVCGKSYSRRSNLNRHACGNKPSKRSLKCKICKISFSNVDEFTDHMVAHFSGETDLSSDTCNGLAVGITEPPVDSPQISTIIKKKKKKLKSKLSIPCNGNYVLQDDGATKEQQLLSSPGDDKVDGLENVLLNKKKKTTHKVPNNLSEDCCVEELPKKKKNIKISLGVLENSCEREVPKKKKKTNNDKTSDILDSNNFLSLKKPKTKRESFQQVEAVIKEEQPIKRAKKTKDKDFSNITGDSSLTSPKNKSKSKTFFLSGESMVEWEQSAFQKPLSIPPLEEGLHGKHASEYEKLVVYEFMTMKVVLPEPDHSVEDLIDEVVQVNDQISLKFFM